MHIHCRFQLLPYYKSSPSQLSCLYYFWVDCNQHKLCVHPHNNDPNNKTILIGQLKP